MNLAAHSIKRPVTTIMLFITMVLIGGLASRLLPLEFFPDVTFPGVFVEIPYRNASPEEVEELITRPVEEAIATIPGIRYMNSNSSENSAGIFVRFDLHTDMNLKVIAIQEKIDGIRNTLPSDMERFFVRKFSQSDDPIINFRISSDRDLKNSYELLNRNLKMRMERLDGVSKVTLYGVEKKQIEIDLIPERVSLYNIDVNQVVNILRRENFSVSAGKVEFNDREFLVRPNGELNSIEEIEQIVISGSSLRLKDIANVNYKLPDVDYGRHLDMKYAIGLEIFKESGFNTVQAVDNVMAELDQIKELPEMSGIAIYTMFNQGEGIVSSLEELLNAGLLGGILSVVVLYVFLRKIGTTLIVATAVPFSLMVTLGALYFFGYSLNILSMMGLMLAIGMLVDNAVVVSENIHRHHQMGKGIIRGTVDAVKEVGIAVTAGTLTSIIVFLPNIINQGDMTAIYLEHVSVSIIIALVASLLISLTVIPLLTSKFSKNEKDNERKKEDGFEKFAAWYAKRLGWLAERKWVSFGLIMLLLLTAAIPISLVNTDMFPNEEGREIQLIYNLNGTYVLEKIEQDVFKMEEYLYENQDKFEIESVYSYYNTGFAVSTITLVDDDDAKKSVDEIKRMIRENLPKIAIGDPVFDWRSMNGQEQMRVHLIGESTRELEVLAEEAIRRLETIPGLVDVRSDNETGTEEVQLVVDRDLAKKYNLSTRDIAQTVSSSFRGQNLKKVRLEFTEVDVLIGYPDSDKKGVSDVKNLMVSADSTKIPITTLASIQTSSGPRRIFRENRVTSLAVLANLDGVNQNDVRDKIKTVLDQINYPAGYGWSYGRSFRDDEEAMNSMLFNMILALIMIYIVMAALFESLIYPASIITSILFAVIGVYWFFMFTNTTFSLMSMIGILVLMGIVVNNGIVLIDTINQLRDDGYTRIDAIVEAGKHRLRPILMTVGTTVLGLIPLTIGTTQIGGDGPPYYPMARAIVGGLTFSTIITLIILPSIYVMLDDLRKWSNRIMRFATH